MNGSIKIPIVWIDKTTGEPFENQDLTEREKLDNYAATLDYKLKTLLPRLYATQEPAKHTNH